AVVGVPVTDCDEEWAGQGELGAAVGVADKEFGIFREDRIADGHPADDDVSQLDLSLVLELADALEPAHALEELSDVVSPTPLAVADAINSGLFLQADREDHHLVHDSGEAIAGHLRSPGE